MTSPPKTAAKLALEYAGKICPEDYRGSTMADLSDVTDWLAHAWLSGHAQGQKDAVLGLVEALVEIATEDSEGRDVGEQREDDFQWAEKALQRFSAAKDKL
jgi:hypothetical protein